LQNLDVIILDTNFGPNTDELCVLRIYTVNLPDNVTLGGAYDGG